LVFKVEFDLKMILCHNNFYCKSIYVTKKMINDIQKEAELFFSQFREELQAVTDNNEIETIQSKYLSRKGLFKSLHKKAVLLSTEEKKKVMPILQDLMKKAEIEFNKKKSESVEKNKIKKLREEKEELSFIKPKTGHLHPITETIREMNGLFRGMGYSVMDGPEIEKDEYCFKRLNVPENHPARDMQDTLYIEQPYYLLRTQTSSIESRTLEKYSPPFKVVSPGRVYRNEKVNKSNHFVFHHYQGFVVMQDVSMKDLFGTLILLFRKMYGADVKIRFRNKYYPEVEPGVGPDMICFKCKGLGCDLCKGVGWIEMGGAGIIHPNVLQMAGIDSKKYSGFAFGLGLDRWVMARYGFNDIRTLLGGNLAYKYFSR